MRSEQNQITREPRSESERPAPPEPPAGADRTGAENRGDSAVERALNGPLAEEAWGANAAARLPRWMLHGATVVFPLLGMVILWVVAKRHIEQAADPLRGIAVDHVLASAQTPRGVAVAFLNSRSVEKRLKITYRPERAREHLEWYPPAVLGTPVEFSSLRALGVAEEAGEPRYFRFAVDFPDAAPRLLCVVETGEGLKVDWDAFARFGTEPEGGPHRGDFTEAEVRVFARLCRYYNYSFSSEDEWVSFQLSSPDWDEEVYGYAPRVSRTATILWQLAAQAGPEGRRVTLQLVGNAQKAERRQYVIREVLAAGWVRGDGDFETAWERESGRTGAASGAEPAEPATR